MKSGYKRLGGLIVAAACAGALPALPEWRPLHYQPEGRSAVAVNGTVRFNRALYCAHSGFRMECSDMPEFGIYLPHMGGNLRLSLPAGDCTARYTPGRMTYEQGGVRVGALTMKSRDLAIWSVTNGTALPTDIPVRFGGVADKRFYREGDLGVDDPTCFDMKPEYCAGNVYTLSGDTIRVEYGRKERRTLALLMPAASGAVAAGPCWHGSLHLAPGETKYILLSPDGEIPAEEAASLAERAERERLSLVSEVEFTSPDAWLNPVGGALAVAADAIWSGEAWLHGAIGWRTPHLGWRGAYTGMALGLRDRALTHFRTYAANQITGCPPIFSHPRQDSALNLARAEKRWGTPFYSDGYICRRPGKKDEMSHYDMNMVYADALLRWFRATGDTAAMRELMPVVDRHLAWERRNFDADGDGLYDAYCCIWASDALYYSGGDVTHSSAYNCFANRVAGDVAELLGLDPAPYRREAARIARAVDSVLWMPERGHWAEFREAGESGRLHPSAAIWTVYHAVDSEIATPFRNYAATCYVDSMIPHIPVRGEGAQPGLELISTSRWKPYSWSINNVAVAEMAHMALAYWLAGRPENGYRLLRSVAADNMYLGASPLNFGQISHYDAARGECYRDFADPVGVWSRALTEGLFGIRPDLVGARRIDISPGFPAEWKSASVRLPHVSYAYGGSELADTFRIENRIGRVPVRLTAPVPGVSRVTVNGRPVAWRSPQISIGMPRVEVDAGPDSLLTVIIEHARRFSPRETGAVRREGPVVFREMNGGGLTWWIAGTENYQVLSPVPEIGFGEVHAGKCRPVDISEHFNANITDIFRNRYLSPAPSVTTLRIPAQGIGDWCHPKDTADIDDRPLRRMLRENGGTLMAQGVPFRMAADGHNIAYASRWDNYPDSVTVGLDGSHASHLYAVVAGSVSHMQCEIENALLTVRYTDGHTTVHPLVSPYNYAPIERDFYYDDGAFSLAPARHPVPRLPLAPGKTTTGPETGTPSGSEKASPEMMNATPGVKKTSSVYDKKGAEGGFIPGGAAVLVDIPVDSTRRVSSLTLLVLSPETVTGLAAVTLQ